jgi:hypothetical protein
VNDLEGFVERVRIDRRGPLIRGYSRRKRGNEGGTGRMVQKIVDRTPSRFSPEYVTVIAVAFLGR